jgi:hypothetical protein
MVPSRDDWHNKYDRCQEDLTTLRHSHTALDQSDMTSLLCIPAHQSLANASQRRSHNTNPESLAAEPGLMSRELGAEGGTNPKLTPFLHSDRFLNV